MMSKQSLTMNTISAHQDCFSSNNAHMKLNCCISGAILGLVIGSTWCTHCRDAITKLPDIVLGLDIHCLPLLYDHEWQSLHPSKGMHDITGSGVCCPRGVFTLSYVAKHVDSIKTI